MLILGLTGSAAMGKSTVAAMFAGERVAVFDADRAVHDLYRSRAAPLVEAAFPGVTAGGAVNRTRLRQRVLGDEPAMKRLEAVVHPLVREEEDAFRARAAASGRRIALLDIPLLFETGRAPEMDAVIVVSAPAAIQRARLLLRPGVTGAAIDALLSHQMSDAEKRRRAHFVVDTAGPLAATRRQAADVLRAIAGMAAG